MKNSNFYKLKHRFQHVPSALTGLSLGIGGVGNCLALIFSKNSYDATWISYITISITILILTILTIRYVLHPKTLIYETKNPLTLSLLPTFAMSWMLVAGFLAGFDLNKYSPAQIIGTILLLTSILIHIILLVIFIKILIKHNYVSKERIFGPYFVPLTGMITSCTISTRFTLLPAEFFQMIWFIGFSFYVLSFPIFTYLLFFDPQIRKDNAPTDIVWFSSANLIPAGFSSAFLLNTGDINYSPYFLNTMFLFTTICGFAFSLILCLFVIHILAKNKFQNFFCSMSFPCAIASTSMILASKYLFKLKSTSLDSSINQFIDSGIWFFGIIGIIYASLTLAIILYILVKMSIICWKMLFTKNMDDSHHDSYK